MSLKEINAVSLAVILRERKVQKRPPFPPKIKQDMSKIDPEQPKLYEQWFESINA